MASVAVIHPGFNNRYITKADSSEEAWAEMRQTLEKNHGGLASGMLANCYEVEVRTPDAPCAGRVYNGTVLRLSEEGLEFVFAKNATEKQWEDALAYYAGDAGQAEILIMGFGTAVPEGTHRAKPGEYFDDDGRVMCFDCANMIGTPMPLDPEDRDEDKDYDWIVVRKKDRVPCEGCTEAYLESWSH